MPSKSSQARIDRSTYIPPHIQQDMNRHMQQNMPAHLKKYTGENAAYVPKHMEATIAKQMERNMPAHLKKYSGAYMQQKVLDTNTTRLHNPTTHGQQGSFESDQPQVNPASHRNFKPPSQGLDTHKMYEDYQQNQAQYEDPNQRFDNAKVAVSPRDDQPHQHNGQGQQFAQGQQNGNYDPNNPYAFILSPEQPKSSKFNFNASLPIKILAGLGILLVVLIVGSILKNAVLGSGGIPDGFVTVAQDQQAMIAVLSNEDNQTNLQNSTKAFAITAQMSLSSSQSELINYMQLNKKKVPPKVLALKVNPATTKQLEASIAASTYDQTFRQIMKSKLTQYKQQLKATYLESTGQKGRAILDDSYNQAELLLTQLDATNS